MNDAILLFDYDGTVRLGSEHATHYARLVAAHLAPEDRDALLAAHAAFLAGKPTTASTFDAYDADNAVRRLAGEFGVADAARHDAYIATRERMAAGEFDVWTPKGFREFLWSLPRSVEVALVTNAPAATLEPVLERLELDGLFDHVIGDAGKPEGLDAILDELLEERPPETLLSIGDIPRNDLAPAADRGCATLYIDHYGRPWPRATASGATLEELYPFIHRWVTERIA
ncbi:HAD family hydrolase [Glycomyces sp. NRRL B-16210]|uniref:HAD family hydrolase n=1 Tax=Glycomyces sp. NRRL B-16210 TaxID=1463821 RepID=UPI0005503064|nr:haloacid dehalogenase-like hydrolase [Glycomyces sp. NRRL B-16210]